MEYRISYFSAFNSFIISLTVACLISGFTRATIFSIIPICAVNNFAGRSIECVEKPPPCGFSTDAILS